MPGTACAPRPSSVSRTCGSSSACRDRFVQPFDHARGRSRRGEDAVPGGDDVAGHAGLGDGRKFGRGRKALRGRARETAQLAAFRQRIDVRHHVDHHLHLPADDIRRRERAAAIGHMDDVDARHGPKELAGEMRGRPVARRREIDLSRVRLRVLDELADRSRRELRIHDQHRRDDRHPRDGREILDRIEAQVPVEALVDRMRAVRAVEQRVAVGRRAGDDFRTRVAAGARPVVDDDRHAEDLRDPGHDDAGEVICPAACRKRDHEPDGMVGIIGCRSRKSRQAGRADDHADQPLRDSPRECVLHEGRPLAAGFVRSGNVGRRAGRTPRRCGRPHTPVAVSRILPVPHRGIVDARSTDVNPPDVSCGGAAPDDSTRSSAAGPRSGGCGSGGAHPAKMRQRRTIPLPPKEGHDARRLLRPCPPRPSPGSAPTASTRPSASSARRRRRRWRSLVARKS